MQIIGNAKIGLVLIGVMVAFFGFVIFLLLRISKKADQQAQGISLKAVNMKTGQDFMPFADIYNDVVDLGAKQYRIILDVSSLNYGLKSPDEQDVLEHSYSELLNILQYPFSIFVQNREINMNAVVKNLKTDILQTLQEYPDLQSYGEAYFKFIASLKQKTGCTKRKSKYLILSYDDAYKMTELSDEEQKAYGIEQIKERAALVIDYLASVGLTAHILTTNELVQLFYSLNHREDDTIVDCLADGDYTSDLVIGNKKVLTPLDDAIRILQEAENKFNMQVMTANLTPGQMETLHRITDMVFEQKNELVQFQSQGGMEAMKSVVEIYDDSDIIEIGGHRP